MFHCNGIRLCESVLLKRMVDDRNWNMAGMTETMLVEQCSVCGGEMGEGKGSR